MLTPITGKEAWAHILARKEREGGSFPHLYKREKEKERRRPRQDFDEARGK